MRVNAGMSGLAEALEDGLSLFEDAVMGGMADATAGLKTDLREQTELVLGRRLAFTWRGNVYPEAGKSLEPAGYVYSKAAKIVSAYASGATIRPVNGGKYLWIPTDAVPRARGGRGAKRKMNPMEVELEFNADLYVRRGRNGHFLAFIDVVRAKSRKRPGYRPATGGRIAQGRRAEPVLMFVLVRNVRAKKLLDLDATAARWGAKLPALIDQNWKG